MDEKQRYHYLQAMGIQAWEAKTATQSSAESELNWDTLAAKVAACQACELYKTRTQAVFGTGNKQAELMIIGEAPGANEDLQGLPFVGRAGQLLTAMLQAIGIARDQVYITNILKSRPPNNRDPRPEEVAACTPYLQQQLLLVKPKLILALGRIAAHFLLNTKAPLGSLRDGKLFKYGTTQLPLLVTYHPAYLLRSPREKRKAYQDLQAVARFLQGSSSQ